MMLQDIPEDLLWERMEQDNSWWKEGRVPAEIQKMKHRYYLSSFYDLLTRREPYRAILLMGQRRIGKTTLMQHAIQRLLEDKKPKNIFYISLDTPIYMDRSLENLLSIWLNHGEYSDSDACFVFFDEIQSLKDWDGHLKSLVDSSKYRHIKFVVSGSVATALKRGSDESGVGRFTDFYLPPLTFVEYWAFTDSDAGMPSVDMGDYISRLNNSFNNYVHYGGYPELAIASQEPQKLQNMNRYIGSDIVDKVLQKDLPSLYGINDVEELMRLFYYLAWNTGREVSLEKLSHNASIQKVTLAKYIKYLEAAFLIQCFYCVDDNAKSFKRKSRFKVYLVNPAIRTALFSSPSEKDMGHLVETAMITQTDIKNGSLYYANWKKGKQEGEIDSVTLDKDFKPEKLMEIKWTDSSYRYPAKELSSIFHFYSKHYETITDVVVTTKSIFDRKFVKGVPLTYEPAAYVCAKRTITRLGLEMPLGLVPPPS